jgi:preprotein translocase subunit SecY
MFKSLNNFRPKKQKILNQRLLLTFTILFFYRLGNTIPLNGIDQEALKKAFLQFDSNNSLFQLLNIYSGGGTFSVSPFSLGIVPYINASIAVDLAATFIPFLEKLSKEEGEFGRKQLNFYKKIVTLVFAIIETFFLLLYLKPYFYQTTSFVYFSIGLQLITGSFLIIWLSSILDKRGIANGTSLIIFANIIASFLNKNSFEITSFFSFSKNAIYEIIIFLLIFILILISQTYKVTIPVISAKQSKDFLKQTWINFQIISFQNGLLLKYNQAGIFPIIIASNLFPFFSNFTLLFGKNSFLYNNILYYFLIILFNYFYTLIIWDPEKISEELRKNSISILSTRPGKETTIMLKKVVQNSSFKGGLLLCTILILYDVCKNRFGGIFLPQVNVSSLIIFVGVSYEIFRKLKSLYLESLEEKKLIKLQKTL